MSDRLARLATGASTMMAVACLATGLAAQTASAQEIKIIKTDTQIDALDPGIRLFVREKMQGGTRGSRTKTSFCSCTGQPVRPLAISISDTRIIHGRIGW